MQSTNRNHPPIKSLSGLCCDQVPVEGEMDESEKNRD